MKPHEFVGIGAGELGMSECESCGLLERDPIHSLKFRDQIIEWDNQEGVYGMVKFFEEYPFGNFGNYR